MDQQEFDNTANATRTLPNRSVYNLIYDNEADEDQLSHSSDSYLEVEDIPLPTVSDSDSSRCSACGQCPDCCEVCTRSRKHMPKCRCGWVKNVLYYSTINAMILLFFIFVLYISLIDYYQDPESPPFKQLLFKPNQYPGLSLIPSMYNIKATPVSVIWYAMTGNDSDSNRRASAYVDFIKNILYKQGRACGSSKKCTLDTASWGPCRGPDYGYGEMKPCIFLKLNRLTLFVPEEYRTVDSIPDDVPKVLKDIIEPQFARIWIHCEGVSVYDREKIGAIKYFPGPYFNSYYFPIDAHMKNNPLIAIRLENLKPGYAVRLKCGMYAKNIHEHDAFKTFVYIKL